MPRRSPARWVAPAALAAAAIAVYVVVDPGRGGPAADPDPPSAADTQPRTGTSTAGGDGRTRTATTPAARGARRTYRVKPGDTLSSIAAANDLTVERLQELNPDADSSSLTVGQELTLTEPAEGE